MDKQMLLIRMLTICGTLMIWFPILVTPIFSAFLNGLTNIDYLLPGQMFIVVFLGTAMLAGAARWLRISAKPLLIAAGTAFGILFLGQLFTTVSTRVMGIVTTGSTTLKILHGSVMLYDLAIVVLGVMGILMIVNCFRNDEEEEEEKIKAAGEKKIKKPVKIRKPLKNDPDDDFDNTPII